MPYSEALAARLRSLLATEPDVTERRMFGGLGFMLAGTMAVGAASTGGLLLRVGVGEAAEVLAEAGTEPMIMRGRAMTGWVLVTPDACRADDDLARWVGVGVAAARTVGPKTR
jgi:TfoX/Sxy family transcriptional regulator of competence genes